MSKSTKTERVKELLDRLQKNREKEADLRKKLVCSLALQELFDRPLSYPCSCWIAGSYSNGFYFHVRESDAERTVSRIDIPDLPDSLIENHLKHIEDAATMSTSLKLWLKKWKEKGGE